MASPHAPVRDGEYPVKQLIQGLVLGLLVGFLVALVLFA